ncbi:MAG: S-layer homology domain-containing protein [Clostridia bacterium]|nr:S-layer homology domain-containing protein [Clostridia bacterium]
MRKILSLLLALIMIISCFPYVASAENIVIENTLALTDATTVRNGNAHRYTALGGSQLVVDYSGNSRRFTYVKFDFAPYKDDIDNISEVKLSLVSQTATATSDFTLELLPDSLENWSSSTLTYDSAESQGMTTIDSASVLCTTDTLTNGTRKYTVDISAAVKNHLKNNTSNTTVAFKLFTSNGNVYVIRGVGSGLEPQLSVKLEVNIDTILQKTCNELTFDKINECSSDGVTKNFNFVTEGAYGTTISWHSDSERVNTDNGIIKRPIKGEGDVPVTLTATIANTGYTLRKTFNIILKESNIYSDDLVLEEYCYAADSTFVRRGASYADVIVNTGDVVCDSNNLGRMGYVKFDFTGYEEYLENANSMQLKIDTKTDANVDNHSNFVAYLLPQSMEDIDTATLTYNIAKTKGLVDYWDNLLFEQKDVAKVTTYYSGDILPAIKKNIDEGGDNVVWLKFASTEGVGYTVYGAVAGEANKPTLVIKYPKPAIELDSKTMVMDRVVNSDINLPTFGEYGSEISWISSDDALISSAGEVRVDTADEDYTKEDLIANLTATFTADGNSLSKAYAVRVRRNGVYDADVSATVTSDAYVADSSTLSVGGTLGRITLLEFDVSDSLTKMKNSRKTVLKLYGSDEYQNKSLTLVPVTDVSVLSDGIDSMAYNKARSIIEEANIYKLSGNFEDGSYITFDITEYLHSLSGKKAVLALCSSDPQIVLESQNGVLGSEPKLVVSPINYTDEYAAQVAADDIEFSDLTNESADFIRENLTLPTSGRFNSIISWKSTNELAVSSDGTVTRGTQNTDVTLTATVRVGSASATKTFNINVRKAETDLEYAASIAKTLAPDKNILTGSVTLKGENLPDGAVASWESSEAYEAKVDGFKLEVTRPNSADLPVTLTVSVTYKGQTAKESFNVTLVRSASKNILRNRKITAGDAAADKAIDEDINTVWNISDSTVTFDLNSARVISGMTIVPEVSSFAGLTISTSEDGYQWETAYTGGSFEAGKLNYITFSPIAYGRYLKLEFPTGASAISFIGAYNFVDEAADDIFSGVNVPSQATSNFALTQSLQGNPVVWSSSSNAITISGYTAIVNRGSSAKNVTLTATVQINNETQTKSYVVYVPANSGGGGSGFGGGSSSGGSGIVASPIVTPSVNPQTPATDTTKTFADIHLAPWAEEYINYLADKGIINGKTEVAFAPNDNLKREEMAKIIALAFKLPNASASGMFTDVNAGLWYEHYVASLYESGITNGMGNGIFGIGQDITRQDAFTMLAKVLKLDLTSYADKSTGFGDDNEISDYARASINALKNLGIVGGDTNGNVNPTAKITRAEIAKVICLAIKDK